MKKVVSVKLWYLILLKGVSEFLQRRIQNAGDDCLRCLGKSKHLNICLLNIFYWRVFICQLYEPLNENLLGTKDWVQCAVWDTSIVGLIACVYGALRWRRSARHAPNCNTRQNFSVRDPGSGASSEKRGTSTKEISQMIWAFKPGLENGVVFDRNGYQETRTIPISEHLFSM